jgi:hypothetical protein
MNARVPATDRSQKVRMGGPCSENRPGLKGIGEGHAPPADLSRLPDEPIQADNLLLLTHFHGHERR